MRDKRDQERSGLDHCIEAEGAVTAGCRGARGIGERRSPAVPSGCACRIDNEQHGHADAAAPSIVADVPGFPADDRPAAWMLVDR